MGVAACPHLSDDPGYTMVEPSGGSCACRGEDFHQEEQLSSGCCSPHVFTSVLLGVLSCVLMTGGVFLAFHRWDPMWLMVSGVGVVLILIGTVLHCCNHPQQQRPKRAGKGCPRPSLPPPADHHHAMPNGSLTEQLLPLSNARSVSQLSLNMLPGYFPPVVTAYGIEQHSAVVQNISRLVQQQQQQSATGSCSPGVSSAAGKSFIVLSLPGDAHSANIQNLVATVYQLDGSAVESSASEASPAEGAAAKPPVSLVHAEVQTCSLWPTAPAAPPGATTCGEISTAADSLVPSPSGSTQTDDASPHPLDLMDCSSDVAPICDNNSCDNDPASPDASPADDDDDTAVLVDIPCADPPENEGASTSDIILVEVPESNPQSLESSSGNLSSATEMDDGELMDRSSPPPSYEELEGDGGGGAFGLAYGTI